MSMSSMNDIRKMMEQGHQNARERIEKNKHPVFDALDAKGVRHVSVRFDGSGDSGGVEEIDISYVKESFKETDKSKANLLDTKISGVNVLECTMFSPEGWQEKISSNPISLQEGIGSIVYDALKATHEGWENNDGAYGHVELDCASRSISMEYYERSTEYHSHEF